MVNVPFAQSCGKHAQNRQNRFRQNQMRASVAADPHYARWFGFPLLVLRPIRFLLHRLCVLANICLAASCSPGVPSDIPLLHGLRQSCRALCEHPALASGLHRLRSATCLLGRSLPFKFLISQGTVCSGYG